MTLTTEKKKMLLLVIMGGLTVLTASYYFGFRWINEARAKTAATEVALTKQVEKMKKTIDDGKAADQKLQIIETKLKPVNEQLPPEQAETWLARAMDTVATRHSLKLKGSRLSDPDPIVLEEAKAYKHFGMVGYAFNVQGTYFKLGEFLADLEGAHPLMVIESMSVLAGVGGATNIHEMSLKVDMVTRKE